VNDGPDVWEDDGKKSRSPRVRMSSKGVPPPPSDDLMGPIVPRRRKVRETYVENCIE
jgi:hypothetical protein